MRGFIHNRENSNNEIDYNSRKKMLSLMRFINHENKGNVHVFGAKAWSLLTWHGKEDGRTHSACRIGAAPHPHACDLKKVDKQFEKS